MGWSQVLQSDPLHPGPLPGSHVELPPPGVCGSRAAFSSDRDSEGKPRGIITESVVPPAASTRPCMEGAQMFADGVSKRRLR